MEHSAHTQLVDTFSSLFFSDSIMGPDIRSAIHVEMSIHIRSAMHVEMSIHIGFECE